MAGWQNALEAIKSIRKQMSQRDPGVLITDTAALDCFIFNARAVQFHNDSVTIAKHIEAEINGRHFACDVVRDYNWLRTVVFFLNIFLEFVLKSSTTMEPALVQVRALHIWPSCWQRTGILLATDIILDKPLHVFRLECWNRCDNIYIYIYIYIYKHIREWFNTMHFCASI